MSADSPPPVRSSAWPAVAALAIILAAVVAGLAFAPKETSEVLGVGAILCFGIFISRRS